MPNSNGSRASAHGCYTPLHYDNALQEFLRRFPTCAATTQLDALRAVEYGRLDRLGHVYLDYTGGGLYAESQLRDHLQLLAGNVFGNPHSNNPTSLAMTKLVESARRAVLDYFFADPDEYTVVCNPGDGEVAHDLRREEMAQCFAGQSPLSYSQFFALIHDRTGKTPSTIRVSLGIVSNFADVYRFLEFVTTFRNRSAGEIGGADLIDRHHTRDAA